jgi:small-conductance mechanosensitive channel
MVSTLHRTLARALRLFSTVSAVFVLAEGQALAADAGVDGGAVSQEAFARETPRRSIEGFLHEANAGNLRTAADYLDLRALAAPNRAVQGPELARKLAFILERQPTLDISSVPDEPGGDRESKTPGQVVVDTVYAGEEPVNITLQREHFPDGVDRWLIDQKTVERIPVLDAAYGQSTLGNRLPPWLTGPTFLGNELWQWMGMVVAALAAYGIARVLAALAVKALPSFARRTPTGADDALVESARRPLRTIFWAVVFGVLLQPLRLTTAVEDVCIHVSGTLLVTGIAWLMLRALGVWMRLLDDRVAAQGYDALARRRVLTQAALLRRIASVAIAFIAISIVLLQFDFVRNVGFSLLASAGVLGVVLGFAAQKSFAALVGGIQFSLTQPVRIGDQVVVEGEFGEIEAIHLTYVVMRVWDRRRLVLPITYFLEKPIENWTHTTTDLVGAVCLKVGFTLPLDALRAELRRACEADALWDRVTCSLQATDSDATTVTVRALVSAGNASTLFTLRCNVRERLIRFVQSYEEGRHLPQWRHVVVGPSGSAMGIYAAEPSSQNGDRRRS